MFALAAILRDLVTIILPHVGPSGHQINHSEMTKEPVRSGLQDKIARSDDTRFVAPLNIHHCNMVVQVTGHLVIIFQQPFRHWRSANFTLYIRMQFILWTGSFHSKSEVPLNWTRSLITDIIFIFKPQHKQMITNASTHSFISIYRVITTTSACTLACIFQSSLIGHLIVIIHISPHTIPL